MSETIKNPRYPGVSPFNKDQRNIFFGRASDIDKLKKLILIRNQVLLYSKSGIGKTSLLNAGVIPLLENKFITIHIRFNAYVADSFIKPTEKIFLALKTYFFENFQIAINELKTPEIDDIFELNHLEKNLWFWFKKIQLSGITNKKILLVFDQFEELFTYPDKMVDDFKNQYYELTKVDIPNNILQAMNKYWNDRQKLQNNIDELSEEIQLKSVFAIRSDRLSELNKLSDKIADIQEVFYELKPLNYEQLIDAIEKPAKDKSKSFKTKPYQFLPETVKKIIKELQDERTQTVETTQLQIVCQQIEEIAKEKQNLTLSPEPIVISVGDLPKFDAVFYNFYENSINKLPENQRNKAKRLIEDELIKNNVRISLDEEVCKNYLDNSALLKLVGTHLLRAEPNNFGRLSYEISHDTLVTPIAEARKKYLEKIEEEKAERERQEALRLQNEKFIKKQIFIFAKNKKIVIKRSVFVIFSMFVLVIGLILYIGFNNEKLGIFLTIIGALILMISSILIVISTIKISIFLKKLQSTIQRNSQGNSEFNIDKTK